MDVSGKIDFSAFGPSFDRWAREINDKMEAAALRVTAQAAKAGLKQIRDEMQAAGLGRLGNALGSGSDLEKGRGVTRKATGVSARGWVYVRSKSDRSRGAIEAYTSGADIRPRKGRWLWIATDDIPRVSKKYRMTPELYNRNGFDKKIGKLFLVRSVNGYPLLVVKDATVSAAQGKKRSARAHLQSGRPPKGQRSKDFIVAFIGIPFTTRAARIDVSAIMTRIALNMEQMFNQQVARI